MHLGADADEIVGDAVTEDARYEDRGLRRAA
jgi:hypothetical protein